MRRESDVGSVSAGVVLEIVFWAYMERLYEELWLPIMDEDCSGHLGAIEEAIRSGGTSVPATVFVDSSANTMADR